MPRVNSRGSKFRPDIQGLRAIAVLLVVIYHAGVPLISGGFVGVDVFFVISGFLITSHLMQSIESDGRVAFGKFYAKRARRILPAALFVGLLTFIAMWLWAPPLLLQEATKAAIATAVYVPNMLFALQGTNYLAETSPSAFQHYWSLGIEEQFYLVWPLALALLYWAFRRRRNVVAIAISVLVALSVGVCIVAMQVSQPWAFFSLPTRAWELGGGALVAWLLRSDFQWLKRPLVGLLAPVGLVILVATALIFNASTPFPGPYALIPVVATAMLIVGGQSAGSLNMNRVLSVKPMQWMGAISYSLYLVHWPLQVIPQVAQGTNDPLPMWTKIALAVAAFPVAWLVYRYIEIPAMTWPGLTRARARRTAIAAIASSVTLIVTAGCINFVNESKPLNSGVQAMEQVSAQVTPQGTSFVPSNLVPGLRAAWSDNALVYENGCHRDNNSIDASGCLLGSNKNAPLVYLFGDSHAANWFPALEQLAQQGKIRLDSNTKSACHSVDIEQFREGVLYQSCHEWRAGVIDRINKDQPDLVLLANFHDPQASTSGNFDEFVERWQAGTASTINSIHGSQVAIIAETPNQGATPAICLSANLESTGQCSVPLDDLFVAEQSRAEQEAATTAGATYIDLTNFLCNESTCPTIIGTVLVYRDAHHLTATFSRQLTSPIWAEISRLL